MPDFWWSDDPSENLFMEITRRDDVGSDLRAPLAARGGVDTPGYALVGAVLANSIVIHYDSNAEAIVGVSRATGERFNQPIWWAARGSYARKANVAPAWLPGLSVALADYQPLASPLPLSVIRQRRTQLLSLREQLIVEHPGQSIYFPWIPYQDTLRTFQTYLAKFPRAALSLLPELLGPISALESGRTSSPTAQPEVEEVERDVESAAGRPRPPRRGQGFATDQRVKVAVEALAMNAALAHYSAVGTVVDTSRHQSYDYEVDLDGELWHVEVKGTTGDATEVLLTPNEVKHAADYPHVALFILSNIEITRDTDGAVVASGGKSTILHPWTLEPSRLTPLGFKYRV